MATNAEFPPYESYDGSKIVGIDPDIFQAICDKLGYEAVIEDMQFIGMAGMTVDPDRLKNVDFTESYAQGLQVIITRKK